MKIARSFHRLCADGKTRSFHTIEDIVDAARVLGHIESHDDLKRDDTLLQEVAFRWIQSSQTACLFAGILAHDPREHGWVSYVLRTSRSPKRAIDALNIVLQDTAFMAQAASVILPDIQTHEDLLELLDQLVETDDWQIETHENPANDGLRLVGLRWMVPGSQASSWVLGFAPFDHMPFTRRFPIPMLAFRLREPPSGDDHEPPRTHLAHMDTSLDDEVFDRLWSRTEQLKENLLAGELGHAAKAKVTFSLPED